MGRLASDAPSLAIPVIDISGYRAGDVVKTAEVAAALRSAAVSPGFFQIVGHGVSSDLRSRVFERLAEFYGLPKARKEALHRSKSSALRGYEAVGDQQLEAGFADRKEGFMIGAELPEGRERRFLQGPNQWPDEQACPRFRDTMVEYFEQMRALSKTIFRLMALSLELDERFFDAFVGSEDSVALCRAHRYPPTTREASEKTRGIGAHTDFGALTLLLQDDVGGLEVFHRHSEAWHAVEPVQDAFVVNIGDMMERWTNDRYMSTLHRVMSPVSEKDRYSVAFFNEGLLDQIIQCIPTCLPEGEKPRYEAVQVEAHLRKRYGSSY